MVTFYTAVGGFEQKKIAGAKRPVIVMRGKRHEVSLQDFIVWSSLLWNIYHYDELNAVFHKKSNEAGIRTCEEFDVVLGHLLERGLVVEGTGYTGADALYELMSGAFPTPVKTSFMDKLMGFLHLTFVRHIPFKITRHLFSKPALTQIEKAVWELIIQQPLSTAELIRCTDLDVRKVSNGPMVVDAIYDKEDGVDYRSVGVHSRFSDRKASVLEAIANLYLKKLILFETVNS